MNQTGPGLIDAVGLAAIRSALSSVLTDGTASTSATISTPTGAPTPDYADGTITPSTADDTVSGLFLPLAMSEIDSSGGRYRAGDRSLRIMIATLTRTPTIDTTVVVGSVRYRVVEVGTGVLDTHHRLILRST